MRKVLVLAGVALVLAGCGEYFDRHPANIRPESEAAAAVLAYRPSASARPSSGTISLAGPAQTTVRESGSTGAAAPPVPANRPAAVVVSTNTQKLPPPPIRMAPPREPNALPATAWRPEQSAAPHPVKNARAHVAQPPAGPPATV